MKNTLITEHIKTDVLIIGGGTAGCYAAIKLGGSDYQVLIAEKANIIRSGCLAAGVNALNAYISEGHTPSDYVEYARKDAEGIVRDDLLLTISERLNEVTEDLERRGLVILKDEHGKYVTRGWRNVKINGENIKPLLAEGAAAQKNVTVLNHVNITDLKTHEENEKTVADGAVGFSVKEPVAYDIDASAVLIATGGAAGLYRPNNPGFSRHKMWYPPFNTGAGFAMGIRAGAEMTTFENRFVALRCKDTIAPTGTIAQGVHAKQVNSDGEVYENIYGLTTPQRIYGTVEENRAGRGPCYLATAGISAQQEEDLYKAYLNMAPSQTLKWLESGKGPSEQNVEVEGTEPYVVGGHTASGFWVDTGRETTVRGLFAAGDAAGGAPQKYVTGALAEGEIAAESIAAQLRDKKQTETMPPQEDYLDEPLALKEIQKMQEHLDQPAGILDWKQLEEAMQKVMDEYAGGIRTDYRYNESRLQKADEEIQKLQKLTDQLPAEDMFDLLHVYEVRERLIVCRTLIAHMRARKETRWHTFGENADYPEQSEEGLRYVNSRMRNGKIEILFRDLVKGGRYEHTDR
ncbi:MAG: adenylyl-sulfate reductase subunit alpha [Clostridiales bacterium]|jgi:adenylylsulfate reductase subunit A|nr:adenylyl-sulfate reductase subunit alpha [Clostridiales bacterium]